MSQSKPPNYWKDWKNFESEMDGVIRQIGYFPTQRELRELKRQDLLKGARHHGTYIEIKEKFGFTTKTKPIGYWIIWSNVESELKNIIEQLGHFPSQKELTNLGYSSLSVAVQNHGGVDEVRNRLGYDKVRTEDKYFSQWENIEPLLRECMKNGNLPSPNELRKDGKDHLVRGVYTYHGGFQQVREKLGLKKSKLLTNEFYDNPERVREKLEEIMEDLGRVSTTRDLKKYSSKLYASICKHFGGLQKLRENYSNETSLEEFLKQYLGDSHE